MTTWHQRLVVWGAAILAACVFASSASAESGVLNLRLEGAGPDGAVYRLRDALFLVRGSDSTFVLATEADIETEVLSLDLRGGSYSIELMPGWRMERTVDDQTTDVDARLTSDNPQTFVVTPAEVTDITYGFEASNLDPGELRLGLEVESAPIDDSPPEPSSCDPVAQTGCSAGQKCTSVAVGETLFHTACVAAGGRLEGQACDRDPAAGADDCAAGLFCVNGACERICATADPVPGCNCVAFGGIFEDRDGVGVCQPTCDILAQDCPAGENCYLSPTARQQICAPPAADVGEQGNACTFLNACDTGYNCILPDPASAEQQCAFACDAEGGSPSCADGPGAEFTCVAMNEFFGDLEDLDDRLGLCIDCDDFPDHPACED